MKNKFIKSLMNSLNSREREREREREVSQGDLSMKKESNGIGENKNSKKINKNNKIISSILAVIMCCQSFVGANPNSDNREFVSDKVIDNNPAADGSEKEEEKEEDKEDKEDKEEVKDIKSKKNNSSSLIRNSLDALLSIAAMSGWWFYVTKNKSEKIVLKEKNEKTQQLEDQCKKLEEDKANLQKEVEESNKQLSGMDKQMRQLEDQCKKLEEDKANLQKEVEESNKQLSGMDKQMRQLEDQCKKLEEEEEEEEKDKLNTNPSTEEPQHQPSAEISTDVKVVSLGESGCGKTCLCNFEADSSSSEFLENYMATVGAKPRKRSFAKKIGNTVMKFISWDTPGEKRISATFASVYSRDVKIIRICFDLSKKLSEEYFSYWINLMKNSAPNDAKFMFLGCKSDKVTNDDEVNNTINNIINGAISNTGLSEGKIIKPLAEDKINGSNSFFKTSVKNKTGFEEVLNAMFCA
ncbi:MAG: Rab family GTPase [Candidatus Improbicoccus pseudotrichonymphae]|uniref:Rab family GTPase n=1 Tax=Candidatus Improbicoccus pseudotrichonymphae TaxID=3033792 RepID=A0AA48I0Y5_9FIRM|nr:MAG: Rab family GTPase [Candidatus Improbicoccus pseudotrichonymphae]